MPLKVCHSLWSSAAREAFDNVENSGIAGGVSLDDLLAHINRVSSLFDHNGERHDARVKRLFTARSFRHYQTLKCIDSPERAGKRVTYGFRHFVQALLVRALLQDRIPLDRIAATLENCSIDETKRMLLEGIEIGSFSPLTAQHCPRPAPESLCQTWRRIPVAVGIEVHLLENLSTSGERELRSILAMIESTLRSNL